MTNRNRARISNWTRIVLCAAVAAASPFAAGTALAQRAGEEHRAGLAAIEAQSIEGWIGELASPWFEGRDSPSVGLDLAAEWLVRRLQEAELPPPPGQESHLWRFTRRVPAPVPERSYLRRADAPDTGEGAEEPGRFVLGKDFVPLLGATGSAEGPLVFAGFGIEVRGYDGLRGLPLSGAVALIVEGDPRHPRVLEGPERSPAANVFRKLDALQALGAAGAIVVRRPYEGDPPKPEGFPEVAPFGFRHSWASWVGERPEPHGPARIPAVEVSLEAAERLAGAPIGEWLEQLDARGRPMRFELDGRRVALESHIAAADVAHNNVLAWIEGRDPEAEILVIGAHYDHVGVDPRGRIGYGADDNASGSAGVLAVARALAAAQPRRSVLVAFFAAEEKGLLGASALLERPPIPIERMGFMLNLDMIGRGQRDLVALVGAHQDRSIEALANRALRLAPTGIRQLQTRGGQALWARSDHFEFHRRGVPALFLFEELPIEKNRDYHTWRDRPELVDAEKVARTARFAFNLLWLLAEGDDLPARPGR